MYKRKSEHVCFERGAEVQQIFIQLVFETF